MPFSRSLVVLATLVTLANLAGCSRTDAKVVGSPPVVPAPEVVAAPAPAPEPKPFAPAEPEPQPTPEEVKAFSAPVKK